jgi:hypothetical protein
MECASSSSARVKVSPFVSGADRGFGTRDRRRGEMPIYYRTSLEFRGDLGGLPSGDRLNWGFVGDLRYWFASSPWGTHPWLEVGYRVVGFNHGSGRQDNLDLQLRGPLLGLGAVTEGFAAAVRARATP